MKKKLLSTLFITGLLATSSVYAQNDFKLDKTTISAGYAS